jgi:protein-S-isoprenylcysteine O-methyltransferase Ste14
MLHMKSPLNRGGLRFYLVIVALIAGALLARATSPRSILAGLPCLLLGVWLHIWAKGCLRQNRVLATTGPYRFVRHPFYLANALIDAGLVIMAGWWPLAVLLPVWWLAIYLPVIRREERFLADNFPSEYPAYKGRVPCLIPWRRPLSRPASGSAADGFRWSNPNIAGGEELPRAVRILAYPLLFFAAQGLCHSGLAWLDDGWNVTGLAGLVMMYLLAWELQGHQRRQRWILPATMRSPMLRVAASAAILAAACYVSAPKTSHGDVLPDGGAVLMLLSVPVFSRRPMRAVAAEALALLGVIAAAELLWLAPALAATYAAWILDYRLGRARSIEGGNNGRSPPPFWPYIYPLLAVACAAVIGVKLVGHALPVHAGLNL